ncbi:GNAT family N-acetyltransferase [Primorskyibacter marinus]|uniref:GNAT family N-acetyltransferase n=1 Tax=Primorskyibacter marinus TaxID=1977320 RepID=UPI000E3002B4|nr:GNAT family N-acetyltransferase [Primorskyibacter marinus]
MSDLVFRVAEPADAGVLWAMLKPVFRAGDTYAIDPQISRRDALAYWTGIGREAWIVEEDGVPLGSYYLKANQQGGGAHVCNCGFVTSREAQGRGVARRMLEHALDRAATVGFAAMQFNFVVASNTRAIDIWQRAGFAVVGRLPGAFRHPDDGFVDALVMYRHL